MPGSNGKDVPVQTEPVREGRGNNTEPVPPAPSAARHVLSVVGNFARRFTGGHKPQGPFGSALKDTFGEQGIPREEGVFFLHPNGKFSTTPHFQNHSDAILTALPANTKARYGMASGEEGEAIFNLDNDRIDSPLLRDVYKEGIVRGRLLDKELHICHHASGVTPAQEKSVDDVVIAHGVKQLSWDAITDGDSHKGGNTIASWKTFIRGI